MSNAPVPRRQESADHDGLLSLTPGGIYESVPPLGCSLPGPSSSIYFILFYFIIFLFTDFTTVAHRLTEFRDSHRLIKATNKFTAPFSAAPTAALPHVLLSVSKFGGMRRATAPLNFQRCHYLAGWPTMAPVLSTIPVLVSPGQDYRGLSILAPSCISPGQNHSPIFKSLSRYIHLQRQNPGLAPPLLPYGTVKFTVK